MCAALRMGPSMLRSSWTRKRTNPASLLSSAAPGPRCIAVAPFAAEPAVCCVVSFGAELCSRLFIAKKKVRSLTDFGRGGVDGGSARRKRTGQNLLDLIGLDGLHHMMVETRFTRPPFVVFLSPSGNRDENHVLAVRQPSDSTRELVAIELRQPDVQKCEIGFEDRSTFERREAVVRDIYLVPHRTQDHREAGGKILVVLGKQNAPSAIRTRGEHRGSRRGHIVGRHGDDGKAHDEPAALAESSAMRLDCSAVQLEQSFGQCQPDSEAG